MLPKYIFLFMFIVTNSFSLSMQSRPLLPNNFLFTTCSPGMEKAIKADFSVSSPEYRFSFSRPGLITWKNMQGEVLPSLSITSPLVRSYGVSIGQVESPAEIVKCVANLGSDKPFVLHVFGRDDGSIGSQHPDAIREQRQRVESTRKEILEISGTLGMSSFWKSVHSDLESFKPSEGDLVIDVVVGDVGEKLFLGHHQHSSKFVTQQTGAVVSVRKHSSNPGGLTEIILPLEAPSRAYLKMEEAIEYLQLVIEPGDVALEIGSAPGGACYSLLQRGAIISLSNVT